MVSGTKRVESAACRETLRSMAFGPCSCRVGGRTVLRAPGEACASYTTQHSAHSSPRFAGQPPRPTISGTSTPGRSAFDGNKRGVKLSGSQTRSMRLFRTLDGDDGRQ